MPVAGIASQILGMSPGTAGSLGGVIRTGLSAAGTTQATATALTGAINLVSTSAALAGVALPTVGNNDCVVVFNDNTGNTMKVYAENTSSTINQLAANTGFQLANNTACFCVKVSATRWVAFLSA